MRWIILGLLAAATLAGCMGDDDPEEGDPTPSPTQTPGPSLDPVTFEAAGPFIPCLGDVNPCLGLQLGPGQSAPDGAWFEINETLWLRPFTTSADTQIGDTDCYVLDAEENILVEDEFNNGQDPCSGMMPVDAAWLFVYSYAEPAMQITVTFPEL